MILNNILDSIGSTPLIPLKKIGKDLKCNLYAKCEFLNPGGSVKDRIALQMIEDAENSRKIKKGGTLIEASSGNTGIGLSLVGAVKGYKVIITMPEKMSEEKQIILEALGAKVIRTPNEVSFDDPKSHIEVAKRLEKEIENSLFINQYENKSNPKVHYEKTGNEIIKDLNGKIDLFVASAGTGGSISGIGKRLKEFNKNIKVIGVDPEGSILSNDKNPIFPYHIEGIGYDFVPDVLNRKVVDEWIRTKDKESFSMAHRLIKEEGLLCGGSSGAAVCASLKACKTLKKGQNCVVLLADNSRNYSFKFLNKKWLKKQRLI